MFKKSLILIITILIIYEIIYQIDESHKPKQDINKENKINNQDTNKETMQQQVTKNLNYSHPMYGVADEVLFEDKQLGSQMVNYVVHRYSMAVSKPWDIIDIIPDYVYQYKYYIKLNRNIDINNWRKLYPAIEIVDGVLMIESNNEEISIALLNLILNHELKNITFQEIMNKDLLNVSVNKLSEHKMVKPKLIDQIEENLNQLQNNKMESFDNNDGEIYTYQTNQYFFLEQFDDF